MGIHILRGDTMNGPNKDCQHRGQKTAKTKSEDGTPIIVYACSLETNCTLQDHELKTPEGCALGVCATCKRQNEAVKEQAAQWQWGDTVEAALTSVGITKDRVTNWLGSCQCAERKKRLNALGQWAHDLLARKSSSDELEMIVGK